MYFQSKVRNFSQKMTNFAKPWKMYYYINRGAFPRLEPPIRDNIIK